MNILNEPYYLLLLIVSVLGIQGPSDIARMVGETAEMKCILNSVSSIIWFQRLPKQIKGEVIYFQNLKEKFRNNMFVDSLNGSLIISKVGIQDLAYYSCRDTSIATMADMTAKLYVMDDLQLVAKVGNSYAPNIIKIGNTVKVTCSLDFYVIPGLNISNYPQLTITANERTLLSKYSVQPDGNTNRAFIYSIANYTVSSQDKEVNFVCRLKQNFLKVSGDISKSFKVAQPITKVIYSPNLDSYKVGDVINCTSDGWPKPQYKWSVKVCAGNCDDPRSGSLLELKTGNIGENEYTCEATIFSSSGSTTSKSVTAKFSVAAITSGNRNDGENVKSG